MQNLICQIMSTNSLGISAGNYSTFCQFLQAVSNFSENSQVRRLTALVPVQEVGEGVCHEMPFIRSATG